jgi:hypothetical protein
MNREYRQLLLFSHGMLSDIKHNVCNKKFDRLLETSAYLMEENLTDISNTEDYQLATEYLRELTRYMPTIENMCNITLKIKKYPSKPTNVEHQLPINKKFTHYIQLYENKLRNMNKERSFRVKKRKQFKPRNGRPNVPSGVKYTRLLPIDLKEEAIMNFGKSRKRLSHKKSRKRRSRKKSIKKWSRKKSRKKSIKRHSRKRRQQKKSMKRRPQKKSIKRRPQKKSMKRRPQKKSIKRRSMKRH